MRDELRQQLQELLGRYSDLRVRPGQPGATQIAGSVAFDVIEGKFRGIRGKFDLRIEIPWDYPRRPLLVRETEGKVKPGEHINGDLSLCLASPIDLELALLGRPTLLAFFEQFVVSFLVGIVVYRRTGRYPFGERSHDKQGALEGLADWLDCPSNHAAVIDYLRHLICPQHTLALNAPCPCGSELPLGTCHEPRLAALRARYGAQTVFELAWHQLELLGYPGGTKISYLQALQRNIVAESGGMPSHASRLAPNIHFGQVTRASSQ